jgi:DNA-binding transcriptional ArsR family regulator
MKDGIPDTFQANFCAEQLKALGEPLRLRIVDLLRNGEMRVGDVAQSLDTELVTVSHHLRNLKHAQIVTCRRDGRFIYYGLRKNLLCSDGKSRQLLDLGCCKIEVPTKR